LFFFEKKPVFGPKGAVVKVLNKRLRNARGLLKLLQTARGRVDPRPDQSVLVKGEGAAAPVG
jgi:hypothetical protein